MSNRNLRDDYIKILHRSVEEMLQYTDTESCDTVAMTKEQVKRFDNIIGQLKLPARVIYMASETIRRVISGFYNKETGNSVCMHHKVVEGGKLKITETNAEYLLEQNPNIFQGISLELIDEDDDDYFEES